MCDCDYDPPDFFSIHIVTARKPCRCCECRITIQVGEKHERSAGKWNGRFDSFRTCLACVELRKKLNVGKGCWVIGDVEQGLIWSQQDGIEVAGTNEFLERRSLSEVVNNATLRWK